MISMRERVFDWCQKNDVNPFSNSRLPNGLAKRIKEELGLELDHQVHCAISAIRNTSKYRELFKQKIENPSTKEMFDKILGPSADEQRADLLREVKRIAERIKQTRAKEDEDMERLKDISLRFGNLAHFPNIRWASYALFQTKRLGQYALGVFIASGMTYPWEEDLIKAMEALCKGIAFFGFGVSQCATEHRRIITEIFYPEYPITQIFIDEKNDSLAVLEYRLEKTIQGRNVLFFVSFGGQSIWTNERFLSVLERVSGPESMAVILGDLSYSDKLKSRYGKRVRQMASQIQFKCYYVIKLKEVCP